MLGQSNKTAYTFLKAKSKILPIKQQLKWCDILQISPEFFDWKKVYENNYFSTIEKKLRSFQIRLNLRSLVMNVQLAGFGIIDSELCSFRLEQPETLMHFFWSLNLLSVSGITLKIGFPRNYKSTLRVVFTKRAQTPLNSNRGSNCAQLLKSVFTKQNHRSNGIN